MSFKETDSESKEKLTQSTVSPSFGYFILNSISVGASLDYVVTKQEDFRNYRFSIGPNIRYYIPIKSVFIFSEVKYLYGSLHSDNGKQSKLNTTSKNLVLSSGLDVFLSRNIALEPSISYSLYEKESSGADHIPNTDGNGKSFAFNININVFIF